MEIAQPWNPVRGFGQQQQRTDKRTRKRAAANMDDGLAEFNKRLERGRPKENNAAFETTQQLLANAASQGAAGAPKKKKRRQQQQQPVRLTEASSSASWKRRQLQATQPTHDTGSQLQTPVTQQAQKGQQGAQPNVAMLAVPSASVREHCAYITLEQQLSSIAWPAGRPACPPPQPDHGRRCKPAHR